MAQIVIVDDEMNIREIMASFLRKAGYDVSTYADGQSAYQGFLAHGDTWHLIVMDIMMPGIDGYGLMDAIRKISNIPIIMVSAKDSEMDKVTGLQLGSDDYLTKPFSMLELTARIESVLRRNNHQPYTVFASDESVAPLTVGHLTLNLRTKEVHCLDVKIHLTQTEYEMFQHLLTHMDEVVAREDLLKAVWGIDSVIKTRVTDDTLKRIRKKTNDLDTGISIETVWGYGYLVKDVTELV